MTMKRKTIKKSIELDAPKEIVWDVLLNDKFTRIWYQEFSEGSHAETDWKLGSKAVFVDNTKKGLIGTVVANKPYEVLSVEYNGWLDNGIEDYDSETAKEIKGNHETYRLTEKNGKTNLSIECDMGEDMYDFMSEAWDRALQKLKQLAESQKQPQS
jgi:uncharacterized protein YndB with AHSA1/START domain